MDSILIIFIRGNINKLLFYYFRVLGGIFDNFFFYLVVRIFVFFDGYVLFNIGLA